MATREEKETIDLVVTVTRMALKNIENQAGAVPRQYGQRIQGHVAEIRAKLKMLEQIIE